MKLVKTSLVFIKVLSFHANTVFPKTIIFFTQPVTETITIFGQIKGVG